jgi:hypothetical protein
LVFSPLFPLRSFRLAQARLEAGDLAGLLVTHASTFYCDYKIRIKEF